MLSFPDFHVARKLFAGGQKKPLDFERRHHTYDQILLTVSNERSRETFQSTFVVPGLSYQYSTVHTGK